MKIKKAVIPVAGLGTRFLPYTKAVPKEMLPIVDVPAIHLIVEEAIKSGIKEILFVTSENKKSIPEYFKKDKKLEKMLKEKGKYKILRELKNVPSDFKASYIIQKKARGLGDAVLHAEKFAAGDSFAVFLPDDIIFSKKPVMKQMIEAFEKHKKHVVSVEAVENKMISSYGIIKPKRIEARIYEILDMIEKPSIKKAYSNLGIVGRYILPPAIFKYIRATKPGTKGEIQLTDALKEAMNNEGLIAHRFEGDRCDTGDKYGYITAVLKYAAMKKEFSLNLKKDIKKIFNLSGKKK